MKEHNMSKKNYNEVAELYTKLSKREQEMFVASIMRMSSATKNDVSSSCDKLVHEGPNRLEVPCCPRCGAMSNLGYITKQGYYKNGAQRYYCKSCKKYFTATTNTMFEGTHKSADVWKKFIHMTLEGKSIAHCADECDLCRTDDYFVRKLVLENEKCPTDVISSALSDFDWEVRKVAVLRPELPYYDYANIVHQEKNPQVIEALKQRLGKHYDLVKSEREVVKSVGVEIEDNGRTHTTVLIEHSPRLDKVINSAEQQKENSLSCNIGRTLRVVNTHQISRED